MSIEFNSLPVDAPLRITSYYGKRNTGIKGASGNHKGVDIGRDFSKEITNILSVANGVCVKNYWNKYRGWVVVVSHGEFETLYQHLKSKSNIAVGQNVKHGQKLGIMGNSSDKNVLKVSVHLHFELIVNGVNVNPLQYLQNIVEVEMVEKVKMEINGVVKEVETIFKDGTNFVKIRELDDILKIDYDTKRKMPIIKPK